MAPKYKHKRLEMKENVFVVDNNLEYFFKDEEKDHLPLNIFVLISLTFQCKVSDLGYFNCTFVVVGVNKRREKKNR